MQQQSFRQDDNQDDNKAFVGEACSSKAPAKMTTKTMTTHPSEKHAAVKYLLQMNERLSSNNMAMMRT